MPVFHIISSLQLILLTYSLINQRVATSLLKKHYLFFDMKLRRPHKANVDIAGKIMTWRENSGGLTKQTRMECTFPPIEYSRVALTTSRRHKTKTTSYCNSHEKVDLRSDSYVTKSRLTGKKILRAEFESQA